MQKHRKTRTTALRPYPTGRATRLPVPRPAGFEPPRVEAPGPSRAGDGLGSASLAWPALGLVLLRSVPPLLEAAVRPRVRGPVVRDLTRWPALVAGGGWGRGTVQPGAGSGGVSAWERRETAPSADFHETRLAPPLGLPSAGCRRQSGEGPQGSGRDRTPFPQNHRCRCHHHRHRPHWGILPQAPPLPRLHSTRLQRLTLEILLLFLLLFQVHCGLLLFGGLLPLVTIGLFLLYRRIRGSNINRNLRKQRQLLRRIEENPDSKS